MRLISLTFSENASKEGINPWDLEKLNLGEKNLIVGRNATGKTRIINVIYNLARFIQGTNLIDNGKWFATFTNGQQVDFEIHLQDGKIINEKIIVDGTTKLDRQKSSAWIYSESGKRRQEISPPDDRLVLHVRRDKDEFPFLEWIYSWAKGVRGFGFANTSPNQIEIPGNPSQLTSLNSVPTALDGLSGLQQKKILKQLEGVGYNIEQAFTSLVEGFSPNVKMLQIKEQGIANPLKQFEISHGMFRAFSLLTIVEYLKNYEEVGSILVDDFGEGLDFERSKKLAEIIFEDSATPKIQIIATTNDSFLMNAVSLNNLTICLRSNQKVRCLNYTNSKEKFDKWKELGLNNFDLFSSNFLLDE